MRAVIDATGYRLELGPFLYFKPTSLLPIAGKPIVFHIIEYLIQKKITQFDLILNYLPQKIEKALGDGERWGASITYHLVRDPNLPFQTIRSISHHFEKQCVLFGSADSLPEIPQEVLLEEPSLFLYPDKKWSGWGIFPALLLEELPKNLTEEDLPHILKDHMKSKKVQPFLSVQTIKEWKESNASFITKKPELSSFPTTARHVQPGVWISRGVSLHPTAKIIPPVFIGEFCQIKKNTTIGPETVIENCCIIDEGSSIETSLVCKNSYIGEGLSIKNSVVDRNMLANLSYDAQVLLKDDFILGGSSPKSLITLALGYVERIIAVFIFIATFPFYLGMKNSHHLQKKKIVRLPANQDPLLWDIVDWEIYEPNAGEKPTLFTRIFYRLPLLKGIILGNLHFVGVKERTRKEVEGLPSEWKKLYLSSKIGLVAITDIEEGEGDSKDQHYASETLYTINKSFWLDSVLFFRWLSQKINKRS